MNITLTIQDCSLQEAQRLFARLADLPTGAAEQRACPARPPEPEPEPTGQPEPEPVGNTSYNYIDPRGKAVKVYHPSGACKVYNSISEAARSIGLSDSTVCTLLKTGKSSRKGFRFVTVDEAGKAPVEAQPDVKPRRLPLGEAIMALKKVGKVSRPIIGYHKNGDIKYFNTEADASKYCTVSVSFIEQNVDTGNYSKTGWRFEYDNNDRQSSRKGGKR